MTLQRTGFRGHTGIVMNRKSKTILMFPLLASTLLAQNPAKQAILMAMGANGKQVTAYQWKQKITVIRKGTPLEPVIEEIRFDATGQPHRMTLAQPKEEKMGPLRAKKKAEIKETIQEVMQLARVYASPQKLKEAIQKGEVWDGPGALRVQTRALIHPMDEVTLSVNKSTYLATRLDCKTQHEGDPIAISIDYEQLPNGPSIMARMTVQLPTDSIVVNVTSFDFQRLVAALH